MKPYPLVIDIRDEREYLVGHIERAAYRSEYVTEQSARDRAGVRQAYRDLLCGREFGDLGYQTLRRLGYQKVFSLKGGLQNWLEAGGLVESSRPEPNLRGASSRA